MSNLLHIPVERGLEERIRWLIILRWLALGIVAVIVLGARYGLGQMLLWGPIWVTWGVAALSNAVCWGVEYRWRHKLVDGLAISFLHWQIILDMILVTVFLHLTGGLENPFSVYYVLLVVEGSMVGEKRSSYVYAAAASAFWVALLLAEATGLLPHYNLQGFRAPGRYQEPAHVFVESMVLTGANIAVAYFTSSIIGHLREDHGRLSEANVAYESRVRDLAELNRRLQERERELSEANSSCELRALELAQVNQQLHERERELSKANSACELRAQELADLNARLLQRELELSEANASCELRAGQLADLSARLSELDRARSMFIRLVTHELRAPVAAIQSYLRLILDGYVPAERLKEIVSKAELRARDQLDLIADLLELARVQEAKGSANAQPVDAAAVLRDVLDLMQVRIQDSAISLTVDVAPNLPCVFSTPENMKQVWMNLVSNALKYTSQGGKVAITLGLEGQFVRGMVRDTGIGISPEGLKHMFETFYRTPEAKAMAQHGTGVGLSITREIIERGGGRIWVESQQGVGSTFSFELPSAPLAQAS